MSGLKPNNMLCEVCNTYTDKFEMDFCRVCDIWICYECVACSCKKSICENCYECDTCGQN